MPVQLIGVHDERELVGNSYCIRNVKGGASLRQVSDRTAACATIEFDRPAFEDPDVEQPCELSSIRAGPFSGHHAGNCLRAAGYRGRLTIW